ncbi:hypothetical protein C8Q74DRAFT_1292850, partial [Fomes fomentarius]
VRLRTSHLPVFSDNIPSLLVRLGVIDLSTVDAARGLPELFPEVRDLEQLDKLLVHGSRTSRTSRRCEDQGVPEEGPVLNVEQVFALWSVATKALDVSVAQGALQGFYLQDQRFTKKPLTLPQHTVSDTCPSTPSPAKSLSRTQP